MQFVRKLYMAGDLNGCLLDGTGGPEQTNRCTFVKVQCNLCQCVRRWFYKPLCCRIAICWARSYSTQGRLIAQRKAARTSCEAVYWIYFELTDFANVCEIAGWPYTGGILKYRPHVSSQCLRHCCAIVGDKAATNEFTSGICFADHSWNMTAKSKIALLVDTKAFDGILCC